MSYDLLLIIVFIMGATAGLIAWDIRDRLKLAADMRHERDEVAAAAKKLSEVHNNLTAQLQAMGDKIAAHDMLIRSQADPAKSLAGRRM